MEEVAVNAQMALGLNAPSEKKAVICCSGDLGQCCTAAPVYAPYIPNRRWSVKGMIH